MFWHELFKNLGIKLLNFFLVFSWKKLNLYLVKVDTHIHTIKNILHITSSHGDRGRKAERYPN